MDAARRLISAFPPANLTKEPRMTSQPTGQQPDLDAIEAVTADEHLTPGPWDLAYESCDCGGDYPCGHGPYVTGVVTPVPTSIAAERCKRTGEQPRDYDFHRGEIGDFTEADWVLMVSARRNVPALAAEVRRLRAERDELIRQRDQIAMDTLKAVSAPVAAERGAQAPEGHPTPEKPSQAAQSPVADPVPLRWGLNDVMWGDDDTTIVMLSDEERRPYWLELDPERAAVLREDLAGPNGEKRTLTESEYNRAWHAVEGAAGEEGADPATVLHAVLDRLSINLPPAPPVHACPPDGAGVTPCCGRTPFELPRTDRATTDPAHVTCPGRPAASA